MHPRFNFDHNVLAEKESDCIVGNKSATKGDRDGRQQALNMRIHLYTEPGCGACTEAKSFLTSRGILFEERDVRSNPEYLRILNDDLDSCTTPTLVAGDVVIVGFDRAEYQRLPVGQAVDQRG